MIGSDGELDEEREAFGADYDTSHGTLMRYPDGRALHAVTITLSLDSRVHAKIVSDRIGHAHEGITVQIYGHRSTGPRPRSGRTRRRPHPTPPRRRRLDDAPEAG